MANMPSVMSKAPHTIPVAPFTNRLSGTSLKKEINSPKTTITRPLKASANQFSASAGGTDCGPRADGDTHRAAHLRFITRFRTLLDNLPFGYGLVWDFVLGAKL